jgi:hypothetical protein
MLRYYRVRFRFNIVPNNDSSKSLSSKDASKLNWFRPIWQRIQVEPGVVGLLSAPDMIRAENHHCHNLITWIFATKRQLDWISAKSFLAFLPDIRWIIRRIIWALDIKFVQNETDDVVIGINEEELSTSSTTVLRIEFITISKESRHKKWET